MSGKLIYLIVINSMRKDPSILPSDLLNHMYCPLILLSGGQIFSILNEKSVFVFFFIGQTVFKLDYFIIDKGYIY